MTTETTTNTTSRTTERTPMMIAPENLRAQEAALTGRAISIYQILAHGEIQVFTGTFGHTTDTALMWSGNRPGERPHGAARTMFKVLLGVVLDQPGTIALGELEVGQVLEGGPLDGAVVEALGDGTDVSLAELAVAYLRTPGGGANQVSPKGAMARSPESWQWAARDPLTQRYRHGVGSSSPTGC